MRTLILEDGMTTVSWYAELALRRRVSMSATGSVMVMALRPSSPRFPSGPSAWSVGAGRAQVGRCGGCGVAPAWWLGVGLRAARDPGSGLPAGLGDAGKLAAV